MFLGSFFGMPRFLHIFSAECHCLHLTQYLFFLPQTAKSLFAFSRTLSPSFLIAYSTSSCISHRGSWNSHCVSVIGCSTGCLVYILMGRLSHPGCLMEELLCCYVVVLGLHPGCPAALVFITVFFSCHSPGHCSWSSAWLC